MTKQKPDESELPPHWAKVQSAIWLIGLAILFWQGWIFPGILILVAISGLTQAALSQYVKSRAAQQEQLQAQQVQQESRARHLPEHCPNCGGPISPTTVQWRGPLTAICPYCASAVKALSPLEADRPPAASGSPLER